MPSSQYVTETIERSFGHEESYYTMYCPHPNCGESWVFENAVEEEARKIDAAIHWMNEHDGLIPDEAPFGKYQCPECESILGLDGSASCTECGFIPEGVRA